MSKSNFMAIHPIVAKTFLIKSTMEALEENPRDQVVRIHPLGTMNVCTKHIVFACNMMVRLLSLQDKRAQIQTHAARPGARPVV